MPFWNAVSGFCVGGAAVAGVGLSYFQFFWAPEASTPSDLLSALESITEAIRENGVGVSSELEGQDVEEALTQLTRVISSNSQGADGEFFFVPRAYQGVFLANEGVPFDLAFPSGTVQLATLREVREGSASLSFGRGASRHDIGSYWTPDAQASHCRLELLGTDPAAKTATFRFRCLE